MFYLLALCYRGGSAHQAHALVKLAWVGVECGVGQRRIAVNGGPALFFDGLAHTRPSLGVVARISARRVDQMLVPVSPRQADLYGEALLGLPRKLNQLGLGCVRLARAL